MPHFGMLVPPYVGHLNPSIALANAIRQRGHRVTFLTFADSRPILERTPFEVAIYGERRFPAGEWHRVTARMGALQGIAASKLAIQVVGRVTAEVIVEELPALLPRLQLDGLIMDQVCPGAEIVAHVLDLPLAVMCNAFPIHLDPNTPPYYSDRGFGEGFVARWRNRADNARLLLVCAPVFRTLLRHRRRLGLRIPSLSDFNELPPSLVQVAQVPGWLDFPRARLPNHFHYTGPWHEESRHVREGFPWEKLDGRPLIYASLGTLQNRLDWIYRTIAEACAGLKAQLVMALGRTDAAALAEFPGSPLVVGYVPQQAVIAKAALVITHAGLNTSLETVRLGVPMVAIPIANEQPAIAARLRHAGLARVIPVKELKATKLREAVQAQLDDSATRARAREAATRLKALDGAMRAAALIEQALLERRRVTATSEVGRA